MLKSSLTVFILLLALAPAIHALQASPSNDVAADSAPKSTAATESQVGTTAIATGFASQDGPELWPIDVELQAGPTIWPTGVELQAGPTIWPTGVTLQAGPTIWPTGFNADIETSTGCASSSRSGLRAAR